jgi:competence protein ComEC
MLLAADAEAEAVHLDPGPLDVLKVAHHGSEGAGLADLLERTRPRLAIVSAGEDNPFGHPTPATLQTLTEFGVQIVRTDVDGTVVISAGGRSIRVGPGN